MDSTRSHAGTSPTASHGWSIGCGISRPSSLSKSALTLSWRITIYVELNIKGRMTRSDKRGAIDADLAPILLRIGANPEAWLETISRFGSKFRLAAGLLSNLRNFADQLGKRWLKGIAMARAAFASSPPQLA
jgi:hypothetical protein